MATIPYIKSTKAVFQMYKALGEKAVAQIEDKDLFWQANDDSNSIATIIKHLHGNMLSRWTDFLTTDGEKPWRQRDSEFENNTQDRESILKEWEEGWQCLFNALDSVTDGNLEQIIYIRNEGHTVLEAINRQVAHYSYHIGQIVYIAKLHANNGWKSLSIPRNKSADYNADKFSKDRERKHYTDDL
jgi:hypothetical protein